MRSNLLIPLAEKFGDFGCFDCCGCGTAETGATLPGMVQSGSNAFTNHVAFELREDCKHASHRTSFGTRNFVRPQTRSVERTSNEAK